MIESFLTWLGNTGWSIRLLESFWMWPLLESTHTLSIAFFVGLAMMMDLRLMGLRFGKVRVSDFTDRSLRLVRIGFAITAVTGVIIFYSNPLRYYHNVFFRFKMLLLVIAGLNIWLFHGRIHKKVAEWDLEGSPPTAARMAGVVSFVAWALIVISGRLIAYNWFDCDLQPQPDWVNWVAQCPVEGE
ncbi:MAG: hypothetical protein PVJ80_04555 [Gemmatimonadota bacterium]